MSETSQFFGLTGLDEARAYLAHDVLGARLMAVSEAVLAIENRTARWIFGDPDDMKLRSCATLFAECSAQDSVFHQILSKYFRGERDQKTLRLLGR